MCGIAGIIAHHHVHQKIFDALTMLQHRGQDASGMATLDNNRFFLRKDMGLVKDVFRTRHMKNLLGNLGIGHVRYPTSGSFQISESQPFYVNSPYGIMMVHNGNLTNTQELKKILFESDLRHINTSSDSEILLNIFAHELAKQTKQKNSTAEKIFSAVSAVYQRCQGSFAVIAIINGCGMLAFRDPNGIRPLAMGKRKSNDVNEYMFASESIALNAVDFNLIGDVKPGEAVFIDTNHNVHKRQIVRAKHTPCLFEYVYLSRPDSIIDGILVYQARLEMGRVLAEKIKKTWKVNDIDVVIPIPDTSRYAAMEISKILNISYREGFVKNRYIGRTFIMPGQETRKKSVKQKLNAITQEFAGKNILLVDDSIVRGTTCKQIIQMARQAQAKKVYFCSVSPAIRHPNVYGIDMPTYKELIAHNRTEQQIAELIAADYLLFQDLEDLKNCVGAINPQLDGFECSVFDGDYTVGNITSEYLNKLATARDNNQEQGINNACIF
jgi:amidophosphoribosyltransferase